MYAQKVAHYINQGLKRNDLTYKELELASGVPSTTLHSWAQGRVKNPPDESLVRIAQVFGDPPEIIQRMRHESLAMTVETNELMARAHDKELMETYVDLINSNVTRLLEQSRIDSDARYVARLNTVKDQYEKLYKEQKENAAANLEECKRQYADAYDKATDFLKREIRYYRRMLVMSVVVALLLLLPLCGYAAYAYTTFDLADPAQGLHQTHTPDL